jgi:hypothetical protein
MAFWGPGNSRAIGNAAEQVLVITAQDGQPLSVAEGPLALRALADRRPGRAMSAISARRRACASTLRDR